MLYNHTSEIVSLIVGSFSKSYYHSRKLLEAGAENGRLSAKSSGWNNIRSTQLTSVSHCKFAVYERYVFPPITTHYIL